MNTQSDSDHLRGFDLADANKVGQKLERFARAGLSRTHMLFDFDRTLTVSDISTWQLLYSLLPAVGQEASQAVRTKYRALEVAGQLSPGDAEKWSSSELGLHATHGTNIHRIEEAARAIKLRHGTKELFTFCDEASLPTVILSAGIRDVIDLILLEHGVEPTVVLSLKLHLSEEGNVIGWDSASMVSPHNKHEISNEVFDQMRHERPFTILVGDTTADVDMATGTDDVLRIRICDKIDPAELPSYLKQSFESGYDMVMQHDFVPLLSLLQWLTKQ